MLVEPVACRFVGCLFDDIGQILGRDAQLLRIPCDILVLETVVFNQIEKVGRELLGSRECRLPLVEFGKTALQVVEQRAREFEEAIARVGIGILLSQNLL